MEKENHKWKVCVRCYTYNQAPYIADAMNGFTMQQTDFPYVCCIVDDASTDEEQDVIRKYISENFDFDNSGKYYIKETDYGTLMFARHKSNVNCFFAVVLLKENHNGTPELKAKKRSYISEWENSCKYEALCEGDDYWTDPLKLQKQVDFLEGHPEYTFACHRFSIFDERTKEWHKEYCYDLYHNNINIDINMELFLKYWVTQPLTAVIRMSSWNGYSFFSSQFKYTRDVHLFYYLLTKGKGISLNQNMGVYRWHDGGIAIGSDSKKRIQTAYHVYKELYDTTKDKRLFKVYFNYLISYYLIEDDKDIKKDLYFQATNITSRMSVSIKLLKRKLWVLLSKYGLLREINSNQT